MQEQQKHITQETIEELKGIQAFLEEEPETDATILIERLTKLNSYMARTGFLLAEAKADQDNAIAAVFAEHSSAIIKMPSQVSQKFISALCEKENFNVTWIERINRTCSHQGDNIRTQVSFAKEEMRLVNSPYGNPR